MGLCSHLNDVPSDSIALLFVAIIANCVCYIRSLLYGLFQSIGFSGFEYDLGVVVGAGGEEGQSNACLAALIVLTEQLNVNPIFAYKEEEDHQCIVCLCMLRDGEHVRKLACQHVFHKDCLDGWLFDHWNLTCPLCRSPLVSSHQSRVVDPTINDEGDLISWFSMTS